MDERVWRQRRRETETRKRGRGREGRKENARVSIRLLHDVTCSFYFVSMTAHSTMEGADYSCLRTESLHVFLFYTLVSCPSAVPYLDISGVTVLDHVKPPVGEVHLQDGAVHQELVDPRVKLRGRVKVLVEDNIRAGASLTFMYEPPQPAPSGNLNTDRNIAIVQ